MNTNMFLIRLSNRIRESISVALLGDGVRECVRIFFLLIWRSVRHAFSKTSDEDTAPEILALRFNDVPFSITITSHEDIMLLLEIFCRHAYEHVVPFSPKTVVDLGANRGVSTLFFCTRFPEATVVAVEPNPTLCDLTRTRVAPFPHVSVLQVALAPKDGMVPFYVHPHSQSSSLIVHTSSMKEIAVRGMTLSSLMQECGITDIDILKFDIEGAEEFLLSDIAGLAAVRSFVGEVHEDLISLAFSTLMSLLEEAYTVRVTPLRKKGRFLVSGVRKNI